MITAVLLVTWSLYVAGFMFRGWIPHDEGTIGQTAERVLHGQRPHRDYDELYTGGVTYLHAAAMRVLGVNLRTPRIVLFASFVAFLLAFHAIARRIAAPLPAAVATSAAVVWSVPNYFVSLPSWYNLFCATFGVLGFVRFLDTDRRFWLVIAGMCGGLSILAKIVGVYYVAAGVLFLIFVERDRLDTGPSVQRWRKGLVDAVALTGCALAAGLLIWQVAAHPSLAELVQLAGPFLLLAAYVAWRELVEGRSIRPGRSGQLWNVLLIVTPFVLGVCLPIGLFMLLYWTGGGLRELLHGVLIQPQARLTHGALSPPSMGTIGLAVPYAALLVWRGQWTRSQRRVLVVVVGMLLGVMLALGQNPLIYRIVWGIARSMPLMVVVAAIWLLAPASDTRPLPGRSRELVFLFAAMASALSVIQFPYASPTYFFYVAPLVVFAVLAFVSLVPGSARGLHFTIALFFVLFAGLFVNRSYGFNLGVQFIPYNPTSWLDLDRGGLRVPREDKDQYETVVNVLRGRVTDGTIYAGPDCPEVYFLSGFDNPTRVVFDFLSPETRDERWMADLLRHAPIRAAVINTAPLFSDPLDEKTLALLAARFPSSMQVGRFTIRF